jgi:CRP/FNR family transcriptional regulator, cyclic AMP receptor protein
MQSEWRWRPHGPSGSAWRPLSDRERTTAAIDEGGTHAGRFGADAVELVIGDEQHFTYCHAAELRRLRVGCNMRLERIRFGGPGDFFGEMTLIEAQNRSASVVADSPTVLYELAARNLYTYYKADIYAYVMVLQNINRELCRRLRSADNRIAELADSHRVRSF